MMSSPHRGMTVSPTNPAKACSGGMRPRTTRLSSAPRAVPSGESHYWVICPQRQQIAGARRPDFLVDKRPNWPYTLSVLEQTVGRAPTLYIINRIALDDPVRYLGPIPCCRLISDGSHAFRARVSTLAGPGEATSLWRLAARLTLPAEGRPVAQHQRGGPIDIGSPARSLISAGASDWGC
jgi:hypothetical protein